MYLAGHAGFLPRLNKGTDILQLTHQAAKYRSTCPDINSSGNQFNDFSNTLHSVFLVMKDG